MGEDEALDPIDGPAHAAIAVAGPGPATTAARAARKREAEDGDAEASLRKRMAGPSSGKAGLGADQEEINRKIYEASRGSKFFENERLKDAETTQRINALLAKRDDAMSRVARDSPEWNAIGKKIDTRLAELEASRDLSRYIAHVDADQFYAAVELKRDPSLKGKAFGVGSGVLTTASYEARLKGCRSGQAVFVAKALCPELIVVPNDFKLYQEASGQIMEILGSYDENMQPASLDEAYLDITDYMTLHQMTAEQVITQLRKEVQDDTGLTVSVGIAANKTLAKICSDRNKPNGQFTLAHDREAIMAFTNALPVRKIPGIGRVTERILSAVKVETCGDIWKHRHELYFTFGSSMDQLLSAYLGLGSTDVRPNDRRERKSVGRETTFRPTNDLDKLKEELRGCADQVEKDLERTHFKGRTVTLVAKKDTFQRFTRAKGGTTYLHKADDLYQITLNLLLAEIAELERNSPGSKLTLRLIGVRVTQLKDLQPPENKIKKLFEAAGTKAPSASNARQEDEDFEEALRLSLIEAGALQDGLTPGSKLVRQLELADFDAMEPAPARPSSEAASRTHDPSADPEPAAVKRTSPRRSTSERSGLQVTASSFSPPRPKAPEKLQGLQFASKSSARPPSPLNVVATRANHNAAATEGSAISHSTTCPICQSPLTYSSNAELNSQIDDCLEGRGHGAMGGGDKVEPLPRTSANVSSTNQRRSQASATDSTLRSLASHSSGAGGERKQGRKSGGGPLDMWLSKKTAGDTASRSAMSKP